MVVVCCDTKSMWIKTLNGSQYQHMGLCFVLVYTHECTRGVATQTEAALISVLESNLARVQNGSLYQLGGSVPCLESGGSSSSDVFLKTAPKEQAGDHLLQKLPVRCEKDKGEAIYVFSTAVPLVIYE